MSNAIEIIGRYRKFGSILGLERMNKLMELLGNPEQDIKAIHVAGTNGKGSVCRYITQVLLAGGYKVGLYTSPFIESFYERIESNGKYITPEELECLTYEVVVAADYMVSQGMDSPTEFEIITAVAFLYFSRQNLDFVVLEVGMGGKGDSTNVIKAPVISVVTSVSYDHMEQLGNTLKDIAGEKAGIIKGGSPVVINVDEEEAAKVVAKKAYEVGSILTDAGRQKVIREAPTLAGEVFCANIIGTEYSNVRLAMVGEHQVRNAITSITVIEILRKNGIITVDKRNIYEAMAKAVHKGRMEIFHGDPPQILDGAHNREGMEALVLAMDELFYNKKILTVIGMLEDKEVRVMAGMAANIGQDFIVTEPDSFKAMGAEALAEMLRDHKKNCTVLPNREQAVRMALEVSKDYDAVLYAGSLYLIGDARRLIYDRDK